MTNANPRSLLLLQLFLCAALVPDASRAAALRVSSLPPELVRDPDASGLVKSLAGDRSLTLDGDASTLTAAEWELALVNLHNFAPPTRARIAALRRYFVSAAAMPAPFVDVATLPTTVRGNANVIAALDWLVRNEGASPTHRAGRWTAAEIAAARRAPNLSKPVTDGLWYLGTNHADVWSAHPPPQALPGLPPKLAAVRGALAKLKAPLFAGPYPADAAAPPVVSRLDLAFPFPSGVEALCMQGNNTMVADASHSPTQLRYAIDLNAPAATPIVAAQAGTAYVYDGGRVGKPDNYGFGNLLLIDLHDGFALLYAHLGDFAVATGQEVKKGQRVATIGNTGPAGADPQLHVQVVPLVRKPDPQSEKYQAEAFGPPPRPGPFGSPQPFALRAVDVAKGAPARIASGDFRCAEAGWLLPRGAIYRAP